MRRFRTCIGYDTNILRLQKCFRKETVYNNYRGVSHIFLGGFTRKLSYYLRKEVRIFRNGRRTSQIAHIRDLVKQRTEI